MAKPLQLLLVEDNPDDAEILLRELRRAGYEPIWQRVETEADFVARLAGPLELILSDYSLPTFSGLRAAQLLRASGRDIPFILVSGMVGEEVAVEAMKCGATDYLLKDRIARLGSAVERALQQKRLRDEHNITELALAEEAVHRRFLLEQAKDGIYMIDEGFQVVEANPSFASMLGYAPDETLRLHPWDWDLVHSTREKFQTVWPELPASHGTYETQIRRKDGSVFDAEISYNVARWNSQKQLFHICRDITERKRAQANLQESEERFRQLAENINEVFWMTDPGKKQMLYISPAYETIWGRTCESLYAQPQSWLDSVHPDDLERVLQAAMVQQVQGTFDEKYRILRPDRSVRWIRDRAFPVRNEAGQVLRLVGVAEDITNHQQLEEQLRQSQKMEAVGQLAGGVAHDFNNILAVIQMQADLLKALGELSPAQVESADEIGKAVQRAMGLTRQLLVFSRREAMQPRDIDLNESITQMTKMLHRILGEDIGMHFEFASQPLLIHADPGMMDQVLMNLAVNSRDAMPGGGELIIETSAVEFDEFAVSQSPEARMGSFVCLSVSDNGCGIPAAILPQIFEPFFTTKDVGKGTGLGLATVFGIVQQHRGWIDVYSEIGQGTTFRIYLPRLEKFSTLKPAQSTLETVSSGNETILVVEDEAPLRLILCTALERCGYRIHQAASGLAALEVWREHKNKISLLLTDMVMPHGMNGHDLATRLTAEKPSLKVIYCSGYVADAAGQDLSLNEGLNFLQKPFNLQNLTQTVRDSLDRINPAIKS